MIHHLNKIRLFNPTSNLYRYPDQTGHFYVHHVGKLLVWDNVDVWRYPYEFKYVTATIQHFLGKIDGKGQEVWEGNISILEISNLSLERTLWLRMSLLCDSD